MILNIHTLRLSRRYDTWTDFSREQEGYDVIVGPEEWKRIKDKVAPSPWVHQAMHLYNDGSLYAFSNVQFLSFMYVDSNKSQDESRVLILFTSDQRLDPVMLSYELEMWSGHDT